MDIKPFIIGKDTTDEEVEAKMAEFRDILATGKDVAFVIRKGALTDAPKVEYKNDNHMIREEIMQHIVKASGEDPIISTTGKASRELFETRVANGQSHKYDFLTVGSMGHSSSIALGVAINKPDQRIWCVDGDGAVLIIFWDDSNLSRVCKREKEFRKLFVVYTTYSFPLSRSACYTVEVCVNVNR